MVAVETKRPPGKAARSGVASAPPPRFRRKRSLGNRVVILVGALFFVGFALYPLAYLVSGALKTQSEIYSGFAHLLPKHPTLTNFHQLLFVNNNTQGISFFTAARNSIFIALMTIAFTVAVSVRRPSCWPADRPGSPRWCGDGPG